jgi:hypothetical protein
MRVSAGEAGRRAARAALCLRVSVAVFLTRALRERRSKNTTDGGAMVVELKVLLEVPGCVYIPGLNTAQAS